MFRRSATCLRGGLPQAVATGAYFVVLMLSVVGSAVIFSPVMVTHPCASALASPFAAPNVHDTAAPGATFNFCRVAGRASAR